MDSVRIIEIKKSVLDNNDRAAEELRNRLRREKTCLVNLMSSPGSGKTMTLLRTIDALKDEMRIGVMEADIDSDVDAVRVAETGVRVVQLHTGGMCHLDAGMTEQGLSEMGMQDLDLIFLENVGNLVCPAEFDTGATLSVMILSICEGHDKPLKYPLMFSVVDAMIVNKTDCAALFDFDMEKVETYAKKLNPGISIFPLSAKTGEGFDAWLDWLRAKLTGDDPAGNK
jgi:hydrogenase nickel incorporation protein HypB